MHEKVSPNALCFMGSSLTELGDIWRELKPKSVSFISDLLNGDGLATAKEILAAGNYKVNTLSHGFMMGQLERKEETWREPRARLSQAIKNAKAVGASCIYMVTGGHGSGTWEDAAACFRDAIAPCVAEAKEAGVPLSIECAAPLYAHTHLAHSLRDTVTLAEMANIGVCIDIFACWTEAGLKETIARAMPRCYLVQVSDYVYGDRSMPCRAVPGDGAIPLKQICEWIVRAGYKGGFDLELLGPRIDQEGRVKAVGRAAQNVSAILDSLGA